MPALKSGLVYAAAYLAVSGSLASSVVPLAAQTPSFEVASVRRNTSGSIVVNSSVKGDRYTGTNLSVMDLLVAIHQLPRSRVVSGPDWINTERFDIAAKAKSEVSYPEAFQMLRSLLVERFGLVVHNELRDGDVYDLSLARDDGTLGPMLRVSAYDCDEQRKRTASGSAAPTDAANRPCPFSNYPGNFVATSIQMPTFAALLNIYTGSRPIRDRTGLTSLYDLELKWTPDQPLRPLPPNAPDEVVRARESIDWNGPTLFTALQEQLGLKLEARRDKIEVLVIDRIERPKPD